MKNKSKLENGEVIERFEKKFGFNLWKEVQGFARGENEPAEVKVGKGWINISNDVKQFIYYALNQQRERVVERILKEYDRRYQKIAKEHGLKRKTPHTMFHDVLATLKEEK